jgi:hypothetical protein
MSRRLEESGARVSIGTMHLAKGLEFNDGRERLRRYSGGAPTRLARLSRKRAVPGHDRRNGCDRRHGVLVYRPLLRPLTLDVAGRLLVASVRLFLMPRLAAGRTRSASGRSPPGVVHELEARIDELTATANVTKKVMEPDGRYGAIVAAAREQVQTRLTRTPKKGEREALLRVRLARPRRPASAKHCAAGRPTRPNTTAPRLVRPRQKLAIPQAGRPR